VVRFDRGMGGLLSSFSFRCYPENIIGASHPENNVNIVLVIYSHPENIVDKVC
jgi:hypothetical protein